MPILPLSQGKVTLIDEEDFDKLNEHKWYYHHTGYAVRNLLVSKNKRKTIFLHRQIISLLDNQYIDHINLDKLDNRKSNLRITDYSQNNANKANQKNNKSGFKGVHKRKKYEKYRAYITKDRKRISLGDFDTALEAAKAYNMKALELFGEFARLNEIA